jgi:DNA-binding XRE family transcriptional regulator
MPKKLNEQPKKRLGRPKGTPKPSSKELDSVNLSPVNRTICERFRQVRNESGLTQEAFAKELQVSIPYIKGVEQGRFTPSHAVLYDMARKYRKSMDWFYGLTVY